MKVDDASLTDMLGQIIVHLHHYSSHTGRVPTLKWVFKCSLKWVYKNYE